jgi:hypothetical protein
LLSVGNVEQAETQLKELPATSAVARALNEVIAAVKIKRSPTPRPVTRVSGWRAPTTANRGRNEQRAHCRAPGGRKIAELARRTSAGRPEFSFGHTDAALAR